jgi:S1-C subfamily serine protease
MEEKVMSGKKMATMGAALFLLVFCGVLAGLQADRWLKSNGEAATLRQALDAPPIPVQSTGPQPTFDFQAAARKVIPAVVSVDNLREGTSFFGETVVQRRGSGSGVIISRDGYILTNNHVVQGASFVRVKLSDGRTFNAEMIGRDRRSDLALLKINATGLTPAPFGDSTKLKPGQWVMAVGSPLGYDNTISVGVVSTVGRTLPTEGAILVDTIQTDAAINQGNSGGALVTYTGELVGINTAIASMDGGSIGIGFSIPVHRARRVVNDLIQFRRARYGSTGIGFDPRDGLLQDARARQELQSLTSARSAAPSRGLLVSRVTQGSPAERAGIKRLDVVLSLDGKAINDRVGVETVMLDKRPGDLVVLEVWSGGSTRKVNLTLADLS